MGYESLSTVIVLVIVVIMLAVWLPRRTDDSMRRVAEHRQDRFSSSLHLVDAESGTRFTDDRSQWAKGTTVQPTATSQAKLTDEHIARVRELRRQAARRRCIVIISLAALTVLVLVLAFALRFSPLFALIPAALLAGALALGVNAAKHAREWERKVRMAKRAHARAGQAVRAAAQPTSGESVAQEVVVAGHEAETDVMEQREIRRVLHDAEMEKARAMALREAARSNEAAQRSSVEETADSQPVDSQASAARNDHAQQTVADGNAVSMEHAGSNASDASVAAAAELAEQPSGQQVRTSHAQEENDHTTQIERVRPSKALDAFEMAVSQDLISFSLGEARNNVDERIVEPHSLEIKSMRQVAKATPVDDHQAELIGEQARRVAAQDAAEFHKHEEEADIEAPAATSDSLGVGLESILSRRSA